MEFSASTCYGYRYVDVLFLLTNNCRFAKIANETKSSFDSFWLFDEITSRTGWGGQKTQILIPHAVTSKNVDFWYFLLRFFFGILGQIYFRIGFQFWKNMHKCIQFNISQNIFDSASSPRSLL